MNKWDTFSLACQTVTETGTRSVAPVTSNYQLCEEALSASGREFTAENLLDVMKTLPRLAPNPNESDLRSAYYERLRVDYNREMQNPLRIDEVKAMARSERAEKAQAAAQAKVVQIAAQAKQAVASGTPVLPETYGDYTLDGKGLRKMAREDMTKFRYLNSVYGTAQVNQRLNS